MLFSMEHNQKIFDLEETVADYAARKDLFPPEQEIFAKYARVIATGRVLDLGVGGGRTTAHLLSRCRSYRAIDYAPAMIEACRRRFPDCAPDVFMCGDARDLSCANGANFDFVLFSYNGLDMVSHAHRIQILGEIRRVLSPDGLFFFSAHSLHAFPFENAEVQARNNDVDLKLLQQRGWAPLIDYREDIVTYYIYPKVQKQQLEVLGFEVVEVLDMKAAVFDFSRPPKDWMVHYVCRLG